MSRAYRLERGSGWQIDPGILHAPGSLLTYEPQVNSDVFAMFQSEVEGRITPWELLVKDVPPDRQQDLDYIIEMLDWDANVNPRFGESNRYWPKPVKPFAETEPEGYREQWVTYGTRWYSAKELTVLPKRTVTIKDAGAYGLILTQGHGTFGGMSGLDARDDSIRTDDGGRALRDGRGGRGGRARSRTAARAIRSSSSNTLGPEIPRRLEDNAWLLITSSPPCTTRCGPAWSARVDQAPSRRSISTRC